MHAVFERLFDTLVGRWKVYQDAPRDPERVTELAAARADLDDTRREIGQVRERLYGQQRSSGPTRPGVAVDPATYARIRISGFQDTA